VVGGNSLVDVPSHTTLQWKTGGAGGSRDVQVDDHGSAVAALVRVVRETVTTAPDVIGHRVVHGLTETEPAFVDARVRGVIEAAAALAPLHNRAALAGIDACRVAFPHVPQAADFDTAFHTTLPDHAAAFALPYAWFATGGERRYGFHGVSHRSCAKRTAELLDVDLQQMRLVSAHLGNGASLAAIVGGRSVDTTMGFTPMDGLMMGSRAGSVDPGLLLYLLRTDAYTVSDLERILSDESGLAGVSEVSEDIRDVIAAAERGAMPARLALDMYVYRIACGIATMAVACGGIDALVFTGGVGEHAALVRERVCARLAYLGIGLRSDVADEGADREIGNPTAAVRVAIVRAREERAIAHDIVELSLRTAP